MIPMPTSDSAATGTVPKILNFVWVGPPMPEWAQKAHRRWEENLPDGWEIKLWDDATLRQHPHPVLSSLPTLAEEGHLPGRGVADLVRLWVVSLYGGVYLDLDTLPVRPDLIEQGAWLGESPGWTAESLVLTNAHFAAPAGHPFLAGVWERSQEQLSRGVTNEHFVAGPRAFRYVYTHTALSDRLPVRTDLPTVTDDREAVEMLAGRTELDRGYLQDRYGNAPLVHVTTGKSRLA